MVSAFIGHLEQHGGVVVAKPTGERGQAVIVNLCVGDLDLDSGAQIVGRGV
jgi:hypothetical protein